MLIKCSSRIDKVLGNQNKLIYLSLNRREEEIEKITITTITIAITYKNN